MQHSFRTSDQELAGIAVVVPKIGLDEELKGFVEHDEGDARIFDRCVAFESVCSSLNCAHDPFRFWVAEYELGAVDRVCCPVCESISDADVNS